MLSFFCTGPPPASAGLAPCRLDGGEVLGEHFAHREAQCHPPGQAPSEGMVRLDFARKCQIVGMVPPSITYSLPVIDAARSEARKATSSATSAGQPGRPSGMPPSDFINCSRAV